MKRNRFNHKIINDPNPELIRVSEYDENKVRNLKNAIKIGVDSGVAKDFEPKEFLESLKSRKRFV